MATGPAEHLGCLFDRGAGLLQMRAQRTAGERIVDVVPGGFHAGTTLGLLAAVQGCRELEQRADRAPVPRMIAGRIAPALAQSLEEIPKPAVALIVQKRGRSAAALQALDLVAEHRRSIA